MGTIYKFSLLAFFYWNKKIFLLWKFYSLAQQLNKTLVFVLLIFRLSSGTLNCAWWFQELFINHYILGKFICLLIHYNFFIFIKKKFIVFLFLIFSRIGYSSLIFGCTLKPFSRVFLSFSKKGFSNVVLRKVFKFNFLLETKILFKSFTHSALVKFIL